MLSIFRFFLVLLMMIQVACSDATKSEKQTDQEASISEDCSPDKASLINAKRAAPPEVEPLTVDGVTYSVSHIKDKCFFTAYVIATDEETKSRKWKTQIYKITFNQEMEKDVQEVYISKLESTEDYLIIETEGNRSYKVLKESGNLSTSEAETTPSDSDNCTSKLINLISSKRKPPPEVKEITESGITYSVDHTKDKCYFTAFIIATIDSTKKVKWKTEVYKITYDQELETDVQDVWIAKLEFSDEVLALEDERGKTYQVDKESGKLK